MSRGILTEMNPGFMDYIWDNFFLNHFKMNGLRRGILTEMNPGFLHYVTIYIWDKIYFETVSR